MVTHKIQLWNIFVMGSKLNLPISENYTHRAEVRASLASNQEWIDEYFSKLLPMLTSQTNVGLISMENGSKPDVIYPEGQGKFFLFQKIS